jgi:S-adenosylmethionine decarboxylase
MERFCRDALDRYAGRHLLAEFWGATVTESKSELETFLLNAAKISRSEPLGLSVHKFEPHGITGIVVLAESHISIHSWPEFGYAAIDIFTCGKKTRPHDALAYLKEIFSPSKVELKEIHRGDLKNAKSYIGEQSNIRERTYNRPSRLQP